MSEENNETLEKAYSEDKERRMLREDELQAARDYLGLLLDEAEGKNEELADKTQEADELSRRLSRTEEEIEELKKETDSSSKNQKRAFIWMCVSLVELLLIAGMAIGMFFKLSDGNGVIDVNHSQEDKKQNTASVTQVPAPVLTAKYADDLAERVKYVSHDSIAPFECSVQSIDGLEYLTFTDGNISVCYKNEYYLDELNFRKSVIVTNGNQRYTFERSYDIANDLVELCPKYTKIGSAKYLVFADYFATVDNGIPETVRMIDCDNFRMYDCRNLADRLGKLMQVTPTDMLSTLEDAPIVYELKTSKATYRYAVSDAMITEIMYNEYEIPELASHFTLNVGEDSIEWSTYVCMGDSLYLGMLSGKLIPSDAGLAISGAKFGAFVPANQEDPALGGFIRPAESVPERFVSLNGINSERYYVAVSDNVPECEYYWDNLETSDSDNWQYFDADGNIASVRGIDVSKYQGNIEWDKVAAEGVEFAIIRMGFRGMNEGTLELDPYFKKNIEQALENNIKVGVYFFSQAVTEEEAVEEADFVMSAINKYNITYPVVFDTERVTTYDARANSLSREDRTKICRTFCEAVKNRGYKPMIYANTKYMFMGIDLEELADYDKWFAYYGSDITFPYNFQMLQYSESGTIPGVPGKTDLNISFVDYSK